MNIDGDGKFCGLTDWLTDGCPADTPSRRRQRC